MIKKLFLVSLIGLAALPVFADHPEFTYQTKIELSSSASFYPRMTVTATDATGGVYFSENASADAIFYMADPLNVTTTADSVLAAAGSASGGFSGGSYMGMDIDSNGTVFASGSGTNRTAVVKITKTGSTFAAAALTMPTGYSNQAGYIRLGGCAAVGPNKIVASGYSDGRLHFFTVSGNTATLDGIVPAPAAFTGIAPDVYYVNGKIFMTHAVVSPASNGGLYAWTSNGTPAGTVTPVQLVTPTAGQSSNNSLYCSISYSPTFHVLALNESHNTTGGQGWKIYDTYQTGSTWTSYKFLTWGETDAPGALPALDVALGHTFFNKDSEEYFITSNEDVTRRFVTYKMSRAATVSDWSVY